MKGHDQARRVSRGEVRLILMAWIALNSPGERLRHKKKTPIQYGGFFFR